MNSKLAGLEKDLDPKDWAMSRELGHTMLDDMFDFLESLDERAVSRAIPEEVKIGFQASLNPSPMALNQVYQEFKETILPYPNGNIHPGYWGWVMGAGSPTGMLAEMLTAAMNSNCAFGDQSATYVEAQVLAWLSQAFGLERAWQGSLTSGCSVANLTALTYARDAKIGLEARDGGLFGEGPLLVYASEETHCSITRALEVLGLGAASLRSIPVDSEYQICLDSLERQLLSDLREGYTPMAIVANLGSVNTGSIDDLETLSKLSSEHEIWLHVDGAFGAMAALSRPELCRGLESVDSIAFDLHKWFVPYDTGGFLVHTRHKLESFEMTGGYISPLRSRLSAGPQNFSHRSLQMSRGFRALKVWIVMKEQGLDGLSEVVESSFRRGQYLSQKISAESELELSAPVPLNIVCFRYYMDGCSAESLNRLNRRILETLHDEGLVSPSYTILEGRFVIRAALTNHRTKLKHLDLLVSEVLRLGRELA